MALVTVQRSPSASNSPPSSEYGSSIHTLEEETLSNRSLSEYYFAVKGFAVLLPKKECQQGRQRKSAVPPADIQSHLQAILHLLRPGDTLQMAVRLESFRPGRNRYLAVVTALGRQDTEESCLVGVDFTVDVPTIGLVLAVLADTMINLDGDGGFSVSSAGRKHIFKPISVQAMWSALQTVHKESGKARDNHCYQGGTNHDWVGYYDKSLASDQSCVNEWNAMDNLESKRPPSPDSLTNKEETELLIRSKLKEIMMSVDIDEVTSKYIRQRLEQDLKMDLFKFKSFIDQEMLIILGQMDAATEIFPHVYLGSEWNASNLEELKKNGVGFILNVTKEIDNFYPGMFDYLNIRVYDDEKTELLRHWDDTFKYITQVREKGSKVLVHCKMGISRSASVVIAYAMKAQNLSLEDATKLVKNKRSCIKPNQAFTSQLKIYQGILDASRQRHNALFRSKSETNLKSSTSTTSHSNTTIFNYAPRGMQILPIPDFKPRSSISLGNDEGGGASGREALPLAQPETTLRVPSPVHGRRPRSWSPDEENSKMMSLQPYDDLEFGEALQKSRSLNDHAWQAHVTVVQRDLRDPGGGDGFIEAVNPLYAVEKSPSNQRMEDLQLSSSVKERINEFESAKTGTAKSPVNKRSPIVVTLDSVTTATSSTDDDSPEETAVEAIMILPMASSPVRDEFIVPVSKLYSQQKHTLPSQLPEGVAAEGDVVGSTDIKSDPIITWPSGIVRKQKEDFEVKTRYQREEPPPSSLSRQCSSHSLSGIDCPSSGGDIVRKEDPFSIKVDKVFDKEEKRDRKTCVINDKRDSPSRSGSWGSFDGAVVLPDRDTPSRQSSWGSCDARLSGGSLLSRNSSFGAFDGRSSSGVIPDIGPQSGGQTNYIAYCIDKENSTLKRVKPSYVKSPTVGAIPTEGEGRNHDDLVTSRSVSNVKAYVAMPFKTQVDSEDRTESSSSVQSNPVTPLTPPCNELFVPVIKSNSESSNVCFRVGVKRGLKTSPQTPEHEIPLPGTVKQQMQKLEHKTKQILRDHNSPPHYDQCNGLNVTGIGRSLSSGCVCSSNHHQPGPIVRSSSEKRAKTDIESAKGNVKKITKALEIQCSEGVPLFATCRSFKKKGKRERPELMPRSHSLERLGVSAPSSSPPTPNKRLSAYSLRSELTSSQNFLDQLVVETQAQVQQLERDQEEISVKNLVGLFEDGRASESKSRANSGGGQDGLNAISDISLEVNLRRKIRPRSESMGEKENAHLPPVPQRKSSLDYTFKPTQQQQHKPQSSSTSPNGKNTVNFLSNGTGGLKGAVTTSPPKPPPQPSQGNRACGSEVRRRKQQGKTHPLSKLTPREKTL